MVCGLVFWCKPSTFPKAGISFLLWNHIAGYRSSQKGRNERCQSLRHRLDFYTIDGDSTYPHFHNLDIELERKEICSPATRTRRSVCVYPQGFRTQ
ncbi:hypothetical protein TNCV_1298541 [Trichonephila clavipes]|nr:hypothetical protein TNCV_1298541 [Trichonephila clavipes]